MLPEDFIAKVREGSDIVELAREYMEVKTAGRSHKALCPFHQEKTPSFHLHADRQIFHCFGCGKGGNVFSLLMELEGMTFPEAVRHLAERQGLTVPETGDNPEQQGRRKGMFAVNEKAAAHYHANLLGAKGAAARKYLASRGISDESVTVFRLGFADDRWDGITAMLRGDEVELAAELGLIRARKEGKGFVDLFRNRLMFPIVDLHERVIGFGGRVWQKEQDGPKYINSSEAPVFNKSASLYGLAQARRAMQSEGAVVLMEGYTDVIHAHQAGVKNAVATLGTALTEGHGKLLRRYVPRVILCYDPDLAGMTAAVRGIHILLGMGFEVAVARLAGGLDPADYVQAHGGPALKKELADAADFFAYHFTLLREQHGAQGLSGKEKIVAGVLPTIAATGEPIRRDEYLRVLSNELRIDERILRQKLAQLAAPAAPGARRLETAATAAPAAAVDRTEREVVRLLVQHPDLWERYGARVRALTFTDEAAREVVVRFAVPLADVLHLLTPAAQALVTAAQAAAGGGDSRAVMLLDDCLQVLRRREISNRQQAARRKLHDCEQAGDAAGAAAALEEIQFWSDALLPVVAARAECDALRATAQEQWENGDADGHARTTARIRRLEEIIETEDSQ